MFNVEGTEALEELPCFVEIVDFMRLEVLEAAAAAATAAVPGPRCVVLAVPVAAGQVGVAMVMVPRWIIVVVFGRSTASKWWALSVIGVRGRALER